jgi:LEA14-like dessication related protein
MRKLLLLASVVAVSACGPGGVNPATLIQPGVKVHHIGVKNVGISGATLDVVLAFHNPNNFTLPGTALTADLDIENSRFGTITMNEPFSLGGKDTTLVSVPLSFRYSAVGSAARAIIDYGAVNYKINGNFSVKTPANTSLQVPFSGTGNVPLLKP